MQHTSYQIESEQLFHALRGSLTGLKASLYLLAKDHPDSNEVMLMQRTVETMTQAIRYYEIVEQAQAGVMSQRIEPLNLYECIQSLVDEINTDSSRLIFSGVAGSMVNTDKSYFKLILIEIITNALRFSSGKVTIGLQITNQQPILECISDKAVLNEDEIARLSEPFYCGAEDRKVGRAGTGLGLAVILTLCAMNKWRLEIENSNTFVVRIRF